jgi:O-phosphoseryl-tRNA(Cys) synthetase
MKEKEINGKVEELRKFISNLSGFHFDEIQKIIWEKEKGNIDINLDIAFKIHNNGHHDCVKIFNKLNELFPEIRKLKEEKER